MPELGTKITDVQNYKEDIERKLSDYGLAEGDLVVVSGHGLNSGGNIYRISKDCPPRKDAVYGQYTSYSRGYGPKRGRTHTQYSGWITLGKNPARPYHGYEINTTRLLGCIEVVPVFSFMAYTGGRSTGKKLVRYNRINSTVKKIDIVALASQFASFQLFINQELKRLQGES